MWTPQENSIAPHVKHWSANDAASSTEGFQNRYGSYRVQVPWDSQMALEFDSLKNW